MARTICIYGPTGVGKTTQLGEYAKWRFKQDRSITRLNSSDLGGYDSISSMVRLGVIRVNHYDPSTDPWQWINDCAEGKDLESDIGTVCYDSGTSQSDSLLISCAKLSAAGEDIGGRPAPKFIINKGAKSGEVLRIGTNVDSHYMVVQGFMKNAIWRSTWLASGSRDVIWTFGLHRGENATQDVVLGPKLAGKALTAEIPPWFNLTFRLDADTSMGGAPKHILYIQPQQDRVGIATAFGNSRYPLAATSMLPTSIEPASVSEALDLIAQGQSEADDVNRKELGL